MTTWVISLLGIVVITLVCDVILPHGETTKYVKTVISVIVVCAIVFPLTNVVTDFDVKDLFDESQPTYQENFLEYVKNQKTAALNDTCDKLLAENGLGKCNTEVTLDDDLLPQSVCVKVEKKYFNGAAVDKITNLVLSVVIVDKSEVTCIVKN